MVAGENDQARELQNLKRQKLREQQVDLAADKAKKANVKKQQAQDFQNINRNRQNIGDNKETETKTREFDLSRQLTKVRKDTIEKLPIEIQGVADEKLDKISLQAQQKVDGYISERDRALLAELYGSLEHVATSKNKAVVIREGIKIAQALRGSISETRFDGIPFIIILTISILKDLVLDGILAVGDTISFGGFTVTFGWTANALITVVLVFFFLGRSALIQRLFFKWLIWVFIIEFIPYLNLLPAYTYMTLSLRKKINNDRERQEKLLQKIEKKTEEVANS